MAVFRVEKTRDYTIMSNCHLKDQTLSLKAKGLLSMMLSLPETWNYTMRGLASICKEGLDAISTGIRELESAGYIVRNRVRGEKGRIVDVEYVIYERPQTPESSDTTAPCTSPPDTGSPYPENPDMDEPDMVAPDTEKPTQLNTNKVNTNQTNTNLFTAQSIHPPTRTEPPKEKQHLDGRNELAKKRKEIQEQIGYASIRTAQNQHQLDGIVELMLEIAMSHNPATKLGRNQEYPTALVQERFEQLNGSHIKAVLTGLCESKSKVRNRHAYLLAALFNAPSAAADYSETYADSVCNDDMAEYVRRLRGLQDYCE